VFTCLGFLLFVVFLYFVFKPSSGDQAESLSHVDNNFNNQKMRLDQSVHDEDDEDQDEGEYESEDEDEDEDQDEDQTEEETQFSDEEFSDNDDDEFFSEEEDISGREEDSYLDVESEAEEPSGHDGELIRNDDDENMIDQEQTDTDSFTSGSEIINHLINTYSVVVFTKPKCSDCTATRTLLKNIQLEYREYVVEAEDGLKTKKMAFLFEESPGNTVEEALNQLTDRKPLPNIWVGGYFIGGFRELEKIVKDRSIAKLLK